MTVDMQLGIADLTGEHDRFGELFDSPHFDQVIAANRLYLTAAVADALATERDYWALSCLPTTVGKSDRYSTLSMGGQETFAVFVPLGDEPVTAHVFVSESVLLAFGAGWSEPGLQIGQSPYVAGGDDQVEVYGTWKALAPALAGGPLRTAARNFAERLMAGRTKYSRFHDRDLAHRVLGLM
jgi:5-methylcytosine-specific restriction protein B